MITRIINGVEFDIEESQSNELYFTRDFIDSIAEFCGDMDQIKEGIYEWNNSNTYLPLSIMWELTNACVFSCPFCYINTPRAKRYPHYNLSEMIEIADSLFEMGMLFCTISGGECLMHPDFVELYYHLKKKGVIVSVFTNAYLINDKIIKAFEEYKPYKVEVSIYGVTDEGFKKATNTAYDYKKVLDNVIVLKKMGIDVRCKSPITTVTSADIPKIRAWCERNDIYYYVSDELFNSYYGEEVDEYRTNNKVFEQAVREKEHNILKNSNHRYGRKIAWNCSAGKYSGVISGDRSFYPCMTSVGIEKYRYSMENGIKKAIHCFAKTLLEEAGKELVFCKGCNIYDVCDKCVLSLITDSEQKIQEHCRYMERFN